MSTITVQRLVSARRASPFPTRRLHSLQRLSTEADPLSRKYISSHKANSPQEKSSSLNLWSQIREARPAVRYTVYAGLGLMATAETTFWFNVVQAKYFPSAHAEEKEKADNLLDDLEVAVKGFKAVWMDNYGKYYGAYIWGVGYGGLDAPASTEDN